MKKLIPFISLVLLGCAHKNPYDITPQQAQSHRIIRSGPGGGARAMDLDHLPPGAVKKVQVIKKGERLPDGRIADRDTKLVSVTIDKKASGEKGEKQENDVFLTETK
jgi:hypothetical protein